jgi:hypothetical protein
MPKPIAELVESPGIVRGSQSIVLVEVRDFRDFASQPPFYLGMGASRRFDLAEMAGEGQLSLIVEILAVKDQDAVPVDRRGDRTNRRSGERPTEVDAADLADEQRMELAYGNFHPRASAPTCIKARAGKALQRLDKVADVSLHASETR